MVSENDLRGHFYDNQLNCNFYSGLKVITRKVNTGNYSNQNNSPAPTLN